MSDKWHALFEIVSGPYDGLTFTVAHDGIRLGDEILSLKSGQAPQLGEFDDVEFEVGRHGVKLISKGSFALNGTRVTGSHELSPGDIACTGITEVLLVESGSSPSD
jgi:hypothetical protein